MEDKNNESLDSQIEESASDLDKLDASALKEKYTELSSQLKEVQDKNRQLFERAKKAEGFEKDGDGNWIKYVEKKMEKKTEKKSEAKLPEKSGDDIDYGLLSFYNSKSETKIEHDEDIEFLKNEMETSGRSMLDLLKSPYFLGPLKERQEARIVKEATPSNTKRTSPSQKDVSFWINQPYEKVPQHMKYAVLDAIKIQARSASQTVNI